MDSEEPCEIVCVNELENDELSINQRESLL